MSIRKCEYIRGKKEEIRDYFEKELKLQPWEDRSDTPHKGIMRYYVNEDKTFEKCIGDKVGFITFFYLESDGDAEWFSHIADGTGNMIKVPSLKRTLVRIDLFIEFFKPLIED